ncbi:TspO/MBR family protein [Clostridium sp.]|uniref:TspO/MBR family protein n=1 Tax=Clostridium sp. TaxID=1506 RepID=UPI0035230E28
MGVAAYRIYMNNKEGRNDYDGYFYYFIQLLINFLWAIIFFNLRLYGISFILTIVLLVLIIITTVKFFKVDKIAGALMIPYIAWVAFASYLTFYVWMFNEM